MSPTADWPASMPKKPGRIAPFTMPQMPGISAIGFSAETTAQSQVEVPITLTSVPFAHAAADRAVVNVEFSDRDRNACGESELRRPFGAKRAGRLGRVVSFFVEPVSKFGETRVERRQEFLVRKAAPIVGIERLVTGGADPTFDQSRIGDAGEHGGNPVGEFDPGEGGAECLRERHSGNARAWPRTIPRSRPRRIWQCIAAEARLRAR